MEQTTENTTVEETTEEITVEQETNVEQEVEVEQEAGNPTLEPVTAIAQKSWKKTVGKFFIGAGVCSVAAVLAVWASLKKPDETKKPFEDQTEYVENQQQSNTGISDYKINFEEDETFPYVVLTEVNDLGEETYCLVVLGNSNDVINQAEEAVKNCIMLKADISKEDLEKINANDFEDIREFLGEQPDIASYDAEMGKDIINAVSNSEEYKNELDWQSAKLLDLDSNVDLTSNIGQYTDGEGNSYVTYQSTFIDQYGKVCDVNLISKDCYEDIAMKRDLTNILKGNQEEDILEFFRKMNEQEQQLLAKENIVHSGSNISDSVTFDYQQDGVNKTATVIIPTK